MTMNLMSSADAASFAEALLAARGPRAARTNAPKVLPQSDAAAYQVQDLVRGKLGPTEGWKVGAANPTAQPNCSPVLKGGIIWAGTSGIPLSIPVPKPTGIEVEIAFKMGRAFPAAAVAPSQADVVAAIASAHIAMELCACRLADGPKSPPLANLADNGMNLGFIIGPEVKNWRAIDMQKQVARAYVDNTIAVDTTGGHTHKDLIALLVWLVGHVVTTRGGLSAGAIVATGSWTGLHWVDHASNVAAEFPGLGRLEARLTM
jgi:2-keto-4-pentenoate hydratase